MRENRFPGQIENLLLQINAMLTVGSGGREIAARFLANAERGRNVRRLLKAASQLESR
jgi:hypothetical protein